jgi:hypothetical protein
MSAFIVDKAHIDALIQAGIRSGSPARGSYTLRWRVGENPEWTGDYEGYSVKLREQTRELTRHTQDRVGAMLWNENRRSVDHRYDEANDREVYRFAPSKVTTPVAILKALDCYEYQSCEHDGWETSEAHAFCAALRRAMIHALPGYEDAAWEITG